MRGKERVTFLVHEKVDQSWASGALIPREKLSPVPEIAPFLVVGLNRTVVSLSAAPVERVYRVEKSRQKVLSEALSSRSRFQDILDGMEHVLGITRSQNHDVIRLAWVI